MKAIDVSCWQSGIDYNAVKAFGIDTVIIRAGYGREISQKDSRFENHYRDAKAAGMNVGAYWYSYADSVDDAITEAETCLSCISGKDFDLPVYYDMEESWQTAFGGNGGSDSVLFAKEGEDDLLVLYVLEAKMRETYYYVRCDRSTGLISIEPRCGGDIRTPGPFYDYTYMESNDHQISYTEYLNLRMNISDGLIPLANYTDYDEFSADINWDDMNSMNYEEALAFLSGQI